MSLLDNRFRARARTRTRLRQEDKLYNQRNLITLQTMEITLQFSCYWKQSITLTWFAPWVRRRPSFPSRVLRSVTPAAWSAGLITQSENNELKRKTIGLTMYCQAIICRNIFLLKVIINIFVQFESHLGNSQSGRRISVTSRMCNITKLDQYFFEL